VIGYAECNDVRVSEGGLPAGEEYDWYQRALTLLSTGNPDAALQLLERLLEVEPSSRSVLEAYARALFDAKRTDEAVDAFQRLVDAAPDDDYAHYGLGLALWRRQRFLAARDELAMAFVMRPDRSEYGSALAQVKATLRARIADGLPLEGPLGPYGAMDAIEIAIEDRDSETP
jgi:predicted Zn-dependent protease